uniref:CSON003850 protein n=1 Tax=Culicoides sonorensis TaxID=179676 RepID=A0A336MMF4_CULSO
MFHCQNATLQIIDIDDLENSVKWKGILIESLKEMLLLALEWKYPKMSIQDSAICYVEALCLRLLAMLVARPPPHTIQDVEDRVKKTFPNPIDECVLYLTRDTVDKNIKLMLPFEKIHSILKKDVLQYKIDRNVSLFLVAIVQYSFCGLMVLTRQYMRKAKRFEITREDIEEVILTEEVLDGIFYQSESRDDYSLLSPTLQASLNNREIVKQLINDEKQYQRDLHVIINLFWEELMRVFPNSKDQLDIIFSNIHDIYDVTSSLLGSLENVIELSQEQAPCIGSCFEKFAETAEFDVYIKYSQDVTSESAKQCLANLLERPEANLLQFASFFFELAVKYYLPKLLLGPIIHAFLYMDYIKILLKLSPSQEDRKSFKKVKRILKPLQIKLLKIEASMPMTIISESTRKEMAIKKKTEMENTVEHWDKDVGQNCNEFIREDTLAKLSSDYGFTERKVFLFNGLLVLCKANTLNKNYTWRLMEKIKIRYAEIIDRPDTDELKHAFEISSLDSESVVLVAKNEKHKCDWMADLIMLNIMPMLEILLDMEVPLEIEESHALSHPELHNYAKTYRKLFQN